MIRRTDGAAAHGCRHYTGVVDGDDWAATTGLGGYPVIDCPAAASLLAHAAMVGGLVDPRSSHELGTPLADEPLNIGAHENVSII